MSLKQLIILLGLLFAAPAVFAHGMHPTDQLQSDTGVETNEPFVAVTECSECPEPANPDCSEFDCCSFCPVGLSSARPIVELAALPRAYAMAFGSASIVPEALPPPYRPPID